VTADNFISVGIFDGFSWIRCEGKGSFVNSPVLKKFGDARISAGEMLLIVDLSQCTGMDSTFMGTLAGMSARISTREGAFLQIAEPGPRNQRSLEDLGLDHLMEIDPPEAIWRDRIEAIRKDLKPPGNILSMNGIQRTRHVLQAHENLSGLNEKNEQEFSNVVELMKKELSEKQEKPDTDSK
jgi:anti-sigma B factor antagonist